MAQVVAEDCDLALALCLSQEDNAIYRTDRDAIYRTDRDAIYRTDRDCYIESVEEERDDVWLDELLSKEKLEDLLAVDICDNLDMSDVELPLPTTTTTTTTTTTAMPPSMYQVTHDHFELTDPTPSIHQLFTEFNQLFFYNRLGGVCVDWSHRMTSCAGITYYKPNSMFCFIRLSKPILTLRPRKDLVETLLHEMIHAFLFVAERNRDHSDHGTQFQRHQNRINSTANSNITIYHSFHDEVKSLKTHWWRCEGACRSRHPYYGYVKRSVNRAPSKCDTWWSRHTATCGGTFVKIRSPDKPAKPANKKTTTTTTKGSKDNRTNPYPKSDIKLYFKTEMEENSRSSLPDNELSQLECIDITITPPNSPIVVRSATTPVNRATCAPATQFSPPRHFRLKQCIFCSGYFQVAQIETHIDECVTSFPDT